MKKNNSILFLFFTFSSIFFNYLSKAHEDSKAIINSPTQTVTYKQGIHIPLIILIDQFPFEQPGERKANQIELDMGLHYSNAAIIISQPILYNFFYAIKYKSNIGFSHFNPSEWLLYRIKDSRSALNVDSKLYLFIPKAKKTLFDLSFNLSELEEVTCYLSPSISSIPISSPVFSNSRTKTHQEQDEMLQDLKQFFKTMPYVHLKKEKSLSIHHKNYWDSPIIDIFLGGHGLRETIPLIANLTPEQIQSLLFFFNNHLRIGVLMVSSCYAGGENSKFFKFKKELIKIPTNKIYNNNFEEREFTILHNLNYIIAIASVGDIVTYTRSRYDYFTNLFLITKNLGISKLYTLNTLLTAFKIFLDSSTIPYEETNIPQIILPNGIEIQSLTPDKNVIILGNVKVKIAEIGKNPLYIYPSKEFLKGWHDLPLNVLIYPSIIHTPLIVRSSKLYPSSGLGNFITTNWSTIKTFRDFFISYKYNFLPNILATLMITPLDSENLFKNYYLYPNLLSMIPGPVKHYFSKLIFQGNVFDGSGGILMGIRDSFLNLHGRKTSKKFFIDEIEGPNDISLILNAKRFLIKENLVSTLEKELPIAGDKVILKNVYISTSSSNEYGKNKIHYKINFEFNDKIWTLKSKSIPLTIYMTKWNWAESFYQSHRSIYEYNAFYQKEKNEIFSMQDSSVEFSDSLALVLSKKESEYLKKNKWNINNLILIETTLKKLASLNNNKS